MTPDPSPLCFCSRALRAELAEKLRHLLAHHLAGGDPRRRRGGCLEGVGVAGDEALDVADRRGVDLQRGLLERHRGCLEAGLSAALSRSEEADGQTENGSGERKEQGNRLGFHRELERTVTLAETGSSASGGLEPLDFEQAGDALVRIDAQDGLAQQRGDAQGRLMGRPRVSIGTELVVISSSIRPPFRRS